MSRPVVSVAIVATLALALVICVGLSSVMDGLLFRPLPFPDPDHIVAIDYRRTRGQVPELAFRPEWAPRRDALRDGIVGAPFVVAATQVGSAAFFDADAGRDLGLNVTGVDSNFFGVFGLAPVLGRTLRTGDEQSPAAMSRDSSDPLPIVIGYELWRRAFGSDQSHLDSVIPLADRSVRIVGVMPPGVKFPDETNVWAPVSTNRSRIPAYVRLKNGIEPSQVASVFPEIEVSTLRDSMHPGDTRGLLVLLIAAFVLLLVTWVQVAALTLSGLFGQLSDFVVRVALGARLRHFVSLFGLENAILGGAALGIAWILVRPVTVLIVSLLPDDLRQGQYLNPDWRSFLFGCALTLVGLIVVTGLRLMVARRAARTMRSGNAATDGRALLARRRQWLLVGQMSLTCALLYLSGLAVHTFVNVTTFDYGFDVHNVLVFTPPPWARPNRSNLELMSDYAEHGRKLGESLSILKTTEGVTAAATFYAAPLGVGLTQHRVPITQVDGQWRSDLTARVNLTSPDFVRALGASMISGKSFGDPEFVSGDHVVIVNQAFARQIAPSLAVPGGRIPINVVGRTITCREFRTPVRIVGVIKDFVDATPEVAPDPQVFALQREPVGFIAIHVNSSPEETIPAVRGTLERVWGPLRATQFGAMDNNLQRVQLPFRSQSVLLSFMAACCLPVAAIGLVGSLSYSVRVRTREIAIRIAIGADAVKIRRSVVRRALILMVTSLLIGLLLGTVSGSLIAHKLFHVQPADPLTIVSIATMFLGLGWIAAWMPARQAARTDPGAALRV